MISFTSLIDEALKARKNCYAPYSEFFVGAAILLKDNNIITGVNIENASYPVSLCAERSAMASVISQGQIHEIIGMAIVNSSALLISPCGLCRQFLGEFFTPEMPIILANDAGEQVITNIFELLPMAFSKESLGKRHKI
jgi:cytidine deaminase